MAEKRNRDDDDAMTGPADDRVRGVAEQDDDELEDVDDLEDAEDEEEGQTF